MVPAARSGRTHVLLWLQQSPPPSEPCNLALHLPGLLSPSCVVRITESGWRSGTQSPSSETCRRPPAAGARVGWIGAVPLPCRTCPPSPRTCTGWSTTCATTGSATTACRPAPSSSRPLPCAPQASPPPRTPPAKPASPGILARCPPAARGGGRAPEAGEDGPRRHSGCQPRGRNAKDSL